MRAPQQNSRSTGGISVDTQALDCRSGAGARLSRLYSTCDRATEWLIYFMVVFSPWAFGTTQPWSIKVMNGAGYLLGGILATKRLLHLSKRWAAAGAIRQENRKSGAEARGLPQWPTRLLAGLTALILGYCLISALNARSTFTRSEYAFTYHDYLPWLPHSYESISTWRIFWNYLALGLAFWAVVDWIVGGAEEARRIEGRVSTGRLNLPPRLRRLLWIVCINGALLALEGILQRTSGTGKLLWLIEPRINKEAVSQFGPYAYRSNAAQYFTLLWPVALGFWWLQHRASSFQRRTRSTHQLLLPCAMLMAACPLISLSRAGAVIGLGGIVAAFAILTWVRQTNWKEKLGMLLFLGAILFLAWYAGWLDLARRFHEMDPNWDPSRLKVWRRALQTAREFPLFGTGPGTFEPLAQFYLDPHDPDWMAQLHNDWLETLITFGGMGLLMIVVALLTVFSRWFIRGGIPTHRVFVMFLWVSLGGCLIYAAVDFPFQIYSILFLFLVLCAVLSCLSRPGKI